MGLPRKGINDRCAGNTGEIKQISVSISIGGCSPFTGFLLLAYRRWKERIPIDVLIAKRRSNVAPTLRDYFQVRSNGAPFSIVNFFSGALIRKNTVVSPARLSRKPDSSPERAWLASYGSTIIVVHTYQPTDKLLLEFV